MWRPNVITGIIISLLNDYPSLFIKQACSIYINIYIYMYVCTKPIMESNLTTLRDEHTPKYFSP